ncbi:MAG: nitrate ABC transporter, permease protein, partial [Verrucomicrobia bacterium]|nr:nitrate ABC transporter, permease protein [Verrucomicrobiota bacterium]
MKAFKFDWLILPLIGVAVVLLMWQISSKTWAKELPTPHKTWEASKDYVMKPFEKRGEMDQGILLLATYSLKRVAYGFTLGILIATPLGFLLGSSATFF